VGPRDELLERYYGSPFLGVRHGEREKPARKKELAKEFGAMFGENERGFSGLLGKADRWGRKRVYSQRWNGGWVAGRRGDLRGSVSKSVGQEV